MVRAVKGSSKVPRLGMTEGLVYMACLGRTSTWDCSLRGGLRKEEEPDMQNAPERVPSWGQGVHKSQSWGKWQLRRTERRLAGCRKWWRGTGLGNELGAGGWSRTMQGARAMVTEPFCHDPTSHNWLSFLVIIRSSAHNSDTLCLSENVFGCVLMLIQVPKYVIHSLLHLLSLFGSAVVPTLCLFFSPFVLMPLTCWRSGASCLQNDPPPGTVSLFPRVVI